MASEVQTADDGSVGTRPPDGRIEERKPRFTLPSAYTILFWPSSG